MATLLKVLNNLADIKSAGGVALRPRTQAMALGEYGPVDLADQTQHLGEMIVIIIDRKNWQLHPYRHLQSLFAAA
jgi:hypothetical protein